MTAPGPPALGRGVVVMAGVAIPPPWADAPVVAVDEGTLAEPSAGVRALHQAWAERRPVVVELAVDPARFRQPCAIDGPVWALDPGLELWEERLHFLVWANTYDARRPDREPVWWWAAKAARLGADNVAGTGPGDIVLPDGTRAWVDGGPRGPVPPGDLDGLALVHRETVERGGLDPAPPPAVPVADLAPDQLAAVAHAAGPARIIAPAGSGKTRVLTERLRHLHRDRRWEPSAVLAVAYNKRAQEELVSRTADLAARTRTLNGLGLHLLTQARGRAPAVLEEREVRRLVERLAPARRRRSNTDPIGPYLEALGEVRLGLRDPEDVEAERDDVPGLAALFEPYRAELAAAGAVDFDEQIYGAVELLARRPAFRAEAQVAHRHLLVDEFQDLTPAHVLLLRLLAAPGFDVFGVGDDDQVIYGHAGADPAFLIDYASLFPGAASHPLEVNYRCRPAVVEAATTLLGYNHRRVAKVIRAGRADPADAGPALTVQRHPAGEGTAALVATVRSWLDTGHPPSSMAVLTRVNSLLLAPRVALTEAGVPVDATLRRDVLERTGLRAMLAYLRLATAPDSGLAARDITEILRRPSRGLPPWFADRLRRRGRWSEKTLADIARTVPEKDAAKVGELVDDLATLRRVAGGGATTADLIAVVRDEIGLAGAMALLDSSKGGEGSSHLDDLEALEQVARLHPEPETFEAWLLDRFEVPSDPEGVMLATVHRVKGMEWDAVVVYGVTAGILPHRLAEDREEERRVLHVAITRGREKVDVLADAGRPSPLLPELDGTAPRRPPRSTAGGAAGTTAGGHLREQRSAPAAGRRPLEPPAPGDAGLEEALKAWRKERARKDKVAAFIVFPDRTLRAIATAKPTSLVALRRIEGIGPTKLEAYGDEVLALVAAQPNSEADQPAPQPNSEAEQPAPSAGQRGRPAGPSAER